VRIAFFEIKDWEAAYLSERLPGHVLTFSPDRLVGASQAPNEAEVVSPFIYSRISGAVLEALGSLRLVATRSTGFDHIDVAACQAREVAVANVPSYGENTVAEHTFALILALSRKVHQSYVRVQHDNFSLDGLTGFDLKDRTLGVIGAGRIGMHVIKIGRGFGMEVLAFDPYPQPFMAELLNFRYAGLEELLAAADIVSLNMPYRAELRHFMNAARFSLMKRGALFINTARGGLVDTDALLAALESGQVGGAGLDVIEGEEFISEEKQLLYQPQSAEKLKALVRNHIIFRRDNVIFTPHNAFNSQEALERILDTTVENIRQFAAGARVNLVRG
jgi:D-lactate dehydrogenase